MTTRPRFVPARSAVLSMDLQAGVVSVHAKDGGLVGRAAAVLRRARGAGVLVIHVKVGFRPGLPEVSSRNLLLGGIKASARHRQLFEGVAGEIHPDVSPEPGDVVITKHRVNAFAGTELDLLLRARDVETLVLFGIATSGVVLSTLLHAADADYRLILVKDCCADLDQELQACLMDRVFSRLATIMSAADCIEMIETNFRTGTSAV